MNKRTFFALVFVAFSSAKAMLLQAQVNATDSLRLEQLHEVVVSAVRVQKNAPFATANIQRKELADFSTTGQELPFLFARTPGVLAWSENGLGTGTTYLRIRGSSDSRINVTLDGVPLNSPEDQCVFWANMNSYASLLGSVQIQRGVGTSTIGDGATGGTISLSSKTPSLKPTAEISVSYGSYNTYNLGGMFSTGLLWNRFVLDAAYHETNTDGYIHGTSGRSGSYYGSLRYITDKFTLAYKLFGNFEVTGQAWNGVTAGTNDLSIMDGTYGTQTGIRTYKDMFEHGLGKYNSLYEQMLIGDDGTYSTQRYTMADGSYWDKTTDNFWQNRHLLTAAWEVNERLSATATLHYTDGYGYYKEFRPTNKLKKFGLQNYTAPDGTVVKKSDFVRKKALDQDTYGITATLNTLLSTLNITGGLSAQMFNGKNIGHLLYVGNEALRNYLLANGDYKYYESDADKLDATAFIKASWHITPLLDLFGEMQYRYVSYTTDGYNDKFIDNGDGTISKHYLDIDEQYNFLNPKAGFSWRMGRHRFYGSVAMTHREPERNNFTDNGNYPFPSAEQLVDYELGWQYTARTWQAGVNAYYMDFRDQLVQTGQVSNIGENLTTNIKGSYRTGIELTATWSPLRWLTLDGNAALSINKIKDFDEYIEDWDDWEGNPDAAQYHCDGNGDGLRQFHYENSTLAFSPSTILNGFITLHHNGWQAAWHTNFVSRQYLDNTENADRSLPCYSLSNLRLSYSSKVTKVSPLKEVVVGLNFNNVFNRRYASAGWVYSAVCESYGHTPDNRYYQIGFIPMSGFTMIGNITLRF